MKITEAIQMKVSIITPSLNQAKFIKETIESVLSQNYPDIEYIVVDGGSTDGTQEILRYYDTKIRRARKHSTFRWVSEKDNGQADAINKGLKTATGDIIAYLNSDDVLTSKAISHVVKIFKTHPRILWVSGDYEIINENGKPIQKIIVWYKRMLRILGVPLLFANPIVQPSTFWRRSLVKTAGLFDSSLGFAFDYDYWLRLSHIQKPFYFPCTLSRFRIHKKSKGGSQYKKQFEEELRVVRRHTKSMLMIFLHTLHNYLITVFYRIIKG